MTHSTIVGGSTAKRVMNCPASVKLCAQMPPKPSSEHADRGTLLHNVIAEVLEFGKKPEVGVTYKDITLTQELIDDKLLPALQALEDLDPYNTMEYAVESRVGFGDFLPGVFGSADVLGRIGNRALVIDWKFGDGVIVDAEENEQLMFYAAAAMRTPKLEWIFKGVDEIELVIVQPPMVKRWVTTPVRIQKFEQELAKAVNMSSWPDAPMKTGSHCRWCAAKPICPQMTDAVARIERAQLTRLPADQIATQLMQADMIEDYIKDLRALALEMLESNTPVPGYKLVAKRATRQWTSELAINEWAVANKVSNAFDTKIKSPAQLEKAKIVFPAELVVSISSGSTLAAESDPRPAVLQIGRQLAAALNKLN